MPSSGFSLLRTSSHFYTTFHNKIKNYRETHKTHPNSVWSKTTLNICDVGGTGNPSNLKTWPSFRKSLALFLPIFNNFQWNGAGEKLSNKKFHFHCCKKCKFMFESFSRSSILLQIVENWHTKCQGHKKIAWDSAEIAHALPNSTCNYNMVPKIIQLYFFA